MIQNFMKSPQENGLAVIVLLALVFSLFISFAIILRDRPILEGKSWYVKMIPVLTLLGLPAVYDLLQTTGMTRLYASIVLVVFLLNIIIPIIRETGRSSHPLVQNWLKWSIPLLVVAGFAVAGYLTFVEASNKPVMCGPSGGCTDVQNSKYSVLFGILPVGMLGLAGFVSILAAWLLWQFGPSALKKWCALAIWGMSLFGVLFSTYLTFLEPFVIGATCMWCICSAVLMILLLWASTPYAQQALLDDA